MHNVTTAMRRVTELYVRHKIYTVIPELRIVTISELANLDYIANSGTPDL